MTRNTAPIYLGLLVAALLFLRPAVAGEFEPPEGGFHPQGPPSIGMAIVTATNPEVPDNNADIEFVGRCRNVDIEVTLLGIDLGQPVPDITQADMKGAYLAGAGPLIEQATGGVCNVSPDLVIQAVRNFQHTGLTIIADIVMLFAVPR